MQPYLQDDISPSFMAATHKNLCPEVCPAYHVSYADGGDIGLIVLSDA